MADPDARPPLVVIPRGIWRGVLVAVVLLGVAAVVGSSVAALNALDSHDSFDTLEDELEDQRGQNAELRRQLDCRYVLSADVDRIQADIFVSVAQALAAARRQDTAAVDLYAAHLDWLSGRLEEASDLRQGAVATCDTEPENVLG